MITSPWYNPPLAACLHGTETASSSASSSEESSWWTARTFAQEFLSLSGSRLEEFLTYKLDLNPDSVKRKIQIISQISGSLWE